MKVKELMIKDVLTCAEEDTIIQTAKRMSDQDVGMLIVVEDNLSKKPTGVISDRDILNKVTLKKLDPAKTKVKDICTKRIISITPDTELNKAVEIMNKNKIKRLVILDSLGNLVGIISKSDLIKQFSDIKKQLMDFSFDV